MVNATTSIGEAWLDFRGRGEAALENLVSAGRVPSTRMTSNSSSLGIGTPSPACGPVRADLPSATQ